MSQKDEVYEKARKLGIVNGRINDSELETMQFIAEQLGMDHYDGLSNEDTDELERRLSKYENEHSENDLSSNSNSKDPSNSVNRAHDDTPDGMSNEGTNESEKELTDNEKEHSKNELSSNSTSDVPQNLVNRGQNEKADGNLNRAHNAPMMGAGARNPEGQPNDKLGNDNSRRMMPNQPHQRPNLGVKPNENTNNIEKNEKSENDTTSNEKKSGDVGSQKLKSSLANRARNLMKLRKKKKDKDTATDNKDDGNSDSNQKDSDNDSDSKSTEESRKVMRKRIKIIKLSIFGAIFFAFLFLIMLIVSFLSGGQALKVTPVISSTTYGTDKFESLTDEDDKGHEYELAYYKKLQEIRDEYEGVVDINYVNAVLLELYYEKDFKPDKEKLKSTGGLDFPEMTKLASSIAKVINDTGSVDYSVDGPIYNGLKNSSTVKNYYKSVLNDQTIDDVMKRVFEIAEESSKIDIVDDTTLTDDTEVSVKIISVDDTTKAEKMSVSEYIGSTIYAKTSSLDAEVVKAYTIAISTNLVAENKNLTVDSNTATASNTVCSIKTGCSYDSDGNLVSGAGLNNGKNNDYYNGGYYYKRPLSSSDLSTLNSNINSVFGNVLVDTNGKYPNLDINKINGLGDGYQTILTKSFGNYSIKNIGEDSYVLDASYGTKTVKTNVIFYDQNNYASTTFCGKSKETIKTSGCGVTSMAMIVSTYENNSKYTPIAMMNAAYSSGYCGGGIVGTSPAFFKKESSTMGYNYTYASKYDKKDLNFILKHLAQGHLVIAHMGPGHFTGSGHYIVLGGVDPNTKKVYVYDPNNKSNSNVNWRNTGNGWYSFNDVIVKETWGFYVIWKG